MTSHKCTVMFVIFILLMTFTGYAQQNSGRVIIWDGDASAFPQVSFTARVVDRQGQSVSGLTSDSFTIGEVYDPPLTVSSIEDALYTAIIVDTSANGQGERQLMRQIISDYSSTVHRDGDITYLFTVGNNTANTARTVDQYETFTNDLYFDGYRTIDDFTDTLESAAAQLMPHVQNARNAQIILISSFLPAGELSFTNPDIKLHVIQAHENRINDTARYNAIGNGQFIEVRQQMNAAIQNFFSGLHTNRQLYAISYRSRAAGVGERQVPVSVSLNGINGGTLIYNASVRPPAVEIVGSESPNFVFSGKGTFADKQNADGSYDINYGKTTEDIVVRVSFPDGIARTVSEATLRVDGQDVETKSISLDAQNQFTLRVELGQAIIDKKGKVELTVAVKDYFNQIGVSPAQDISIAYQYPELESITVSVDVCAVDGEKYGTPECAIKDNAGIAYGTIAALGLAVVGALVVIAWQGRKLSNVASAAVGRVSIFGAAVTQQAVEIGRKTAVAFGMTRPGPTEVEQGNGQPTPPTPYNPALPPSKPGDSTSVEGLNDPFPSGAFAVLEVLKCPTAVGNILMKDMILTIGRQEDFVDALINDPNISRRHCELTFDREQKVFYIVDSGSVNGTFVNGVQVASTPIRIKDGDKIRLGKKQPYEFNFAVHPEYLQPSVDLEGQTSKVIGPRPEPDTKTDVVRKFRPNFGDYDVENADEQEDMDDVPRYIPPIAPQPNGNKPSKPTRNTADEDWLN